MSHGNIDDTALDQAAQTRRYGKHAVTLKSWRDKYGYPPPDFYVGSLPYVWLSKLQAWEATQPARHARAGKQPHVNPRGREAAQVGP